MKWLSWGWKVFSEPHLTRKQFPSGVYFAFAIRAPSLLDPTLPRKIEIARKALHLMTTSF
jgi:hypothetical protein